MGLWKKAAANFLDIPSASSSSYSMRGFRRLLLPVATLLFASFLLLLFLSALSSSSPFSPPAAVLSWFSSFSSSPAQPRDASPTSSSPAALDHFGNSTSGSTSGTSSTIAASGTKNDRRDDGRLPEKGGSAANHSTAAPPLPVLVIDQVLQEANSSSGSGTNTTSSPSSGDRLVKVSDSSGDSVDPSASGGRPSGNNSSRYIAGGVDQVLREANSSSGGSTKTTGSPSAGYRFVNASNSSGGSVDQSAAGGRPSGNNSSSYIAGGVDQVLREANSSSGGSTNTTSTPSSGDRLVKVSNSSGSVNRSAAGGRPTGYNSSSFIAGGVNQVLRNANSSSGGSTKTTNNPSAASNSSGGSVDPSVAEGRPSGNNSIGYIAGGVDKGPGGGVIIEKVDPVAKPTKDIVAVGSGRSAGGLSSECNIFDGRWIKDDQMPYYPPGTCPHIDDDFNCHKNGRPDGDYLKWRWQPYHCYIPRLNASDFLHRLRGKRLLFVGDSLNRNMWESLVCILRHSVRDKKRVYEASGKTQFKTKGYYSFVFKDYKCSIDFVRSPFLVSETYYKHLNGSEYERLRLDLLDETTLAYHQADVIVFNTGHWWTHEKTSKGIGYYQEGDHLYPLLKVLEAYKKALITWSRWIDRNIDPNKTQVVFRGYSLTHFRGGQWNSGGQCHKETEPIFNQSYLAHYPSKMRVLESVLGKMKTPVIYLNISKLTDFRKDGHPSIYRKLYKSVQEQIAAEKSQDCSHWCLPGVPDSWNELLYASLLRIGKGSWKR